MSDPQGLAFDPVAEDYDLGRAGWPQELLDGVKADAVLDLGAGTGKLTGLLVERYPLVHAVEPLARMRAALVRNVPRADVLPGNAERIPLDEGSVDAVFVAEAFHWFDSKAAVLEIARVLRSHGTLVVAFNEWVESWELPDAARAAIEQRAAKLPPAGGSKIATGDWMKGFEGAPFAVLEERLLPHVWETDRAGVAAYYVSISSIAQLPPDERELLRAELLEVLPDGRYQLQLAARAFQTRRHPR
ncbi:MAG TPA: class I SAM-dependent methyltransferase [Gaiellaceae bacterium]|jgi:SAM-dependent methyltransferase|nr:class I SAM-dependent methyltransferase [Gaiellaceae bacterium]